MMLCDAGADICAFAAVPAAHWFISNHSAGQINERRVASIAGTPVYERATR
jgi:hypothetical protein